MFTEEDLRQCHEFKDKYIYKLSYDEMLYRNNYPKLTNEDEKTIKLILLNYNYDKKLKPLVYKLYEYTDTSNLLYCCLNVQGVRLIKYKLKSKDPKDKMMYRLIDGSYDKLDNSILYKYKGAITHELLHMASTKPSYHNMGKKSGFSYVKGETKYNSGINEGYTELLDRRIFYGGNYNTYSYRKKVYFMRLVELLYDNKKDMESDYFKADYKSFEKQFFKYGNMDEYKNLSLILDKPDFLVSDDEVKNTFLLLQGIVKRTDNEEKLRECERYTNEYYKVKSV